jgi:4-diphosphocytidyl-2C-methyl-D-erythritol kinase
MVYDDYNHNNDLYQALAARINKLIQKNSIDFIVNLCANMLQIGCFRLYKEIAELKNRIESIGLSPLCLSGSGSTMYYVVPGRNKELAGEYQQKLTRIGCKSILVSNNGW